MSNRSVKTKLQNTSAPMYIPDVQNFKRYFPDMEMRICKFRFLNAYQQLFYFFSIF